MRWETVATQSKEQRSAHHRRGCSTDQPESRRATPAWECLVLDAYARYRTRSSRSGGEPSTDRSRQIDARKYQRAKKAIAHFVALAEGLCGETNLKDGSDAAHCSFAI